MNLRFVGLVRLTKQGWLNSNPDHLCSTQSTRFLRTSSRAHANAREGRVTLQTAGLGNSSRKN